MKKPNSMSVLLFLTGLLCIVSLLFFNYSTWKKIVSTEKDVSDVIKKVSEKKEELKEANNNYEDAIEETESVITYLTQKAQTEQHEQTLERAEETGAETAGPSVFSQDASGSDSDAFTSEASHIIGIDPGHQSENVDMSALEPNGPGSSEMKAKCSTGTSGSYTGVPEYQLNLNISLQLKEVLEQKGYQVVMTRTDNETAISNKERAEYVASQGADIYVRIHANGDDSHTASGALTMAPSAGNPYVAGLHDESTRLSQCILDSYCAATGFQNLGVQFYDNMTGINWSTVPVTIIEMGFMTNENDDTLMNDPAFQQKMVQGIADGIDAYYN